MPGAAGDDQAEAHRNHRRLLVGDLGVLGFRIGFYRARASEGLTAVFWSLIEY